MLDALVRHNGTAAYRDALTSLGRELATAIVSKVGPVRKAFGLVSTPEDADFLTRGMLQVLPRRQARLACYWTDRRAFDDGDVATVIQEYEDPRLHGRLEMVVIAKAIISSSCVVRTNLEKFLVRTSPQRIVIAAPVMLRGAEKRLKDAFSAELASRFEFVTFALDTKTKASVVVPGVGGMVDDRLGLGSKSARFMPALVSEWKSAPPAER